MTNKQRFLVIIQLCFAFSLFLWFLVQPFMGEYFSLRSRMLFYEYVMGTSDLLKKQEDQKNKLENNKMRFTKLPEFEKERIAQNYQILQDYAQRPASVKTLDGIKILFFYIPIFQLAWIFFALTIGVLLLLNKPGARQAAWLLPVLAFCYGIDNYQNGQVLAPSADQIIFPSEKELLQDYVAYQANDENLSSHENLKKAWHYYLIAHWSQEKGENQKEQLEEAEFHFTKARLLLMQKENPQQWIISLRERTNGWLLMLYFIWNIYFAWKMNKNSPQIT